MAGVFAVGMAQTKSPTKRKNPTKHPAEWARKGLVCFFFWLVCACSFLLLPNLTLGLPCFVMHTRVRVHVCALAISCTVISCAWWWFWLAYRARWHNCWFDFWWRSILDYKTVNTVSIADLVVSLDSYTGWWFQIFLIFTPTWGRFPFWRVETTN